MRKSARTKGDAGRPLLRPAIASIPGSRHYLGGIGASKFYADILPFLDVVKIGTRTFVTFESLDRFIEASRRFVGCADEPSRAVTPPSGRGHTDRRLAKQSEVTPERLTQRQKVEETPSPTPEEDTWLARIECSPLTLTHGKNGPRYSLRNGTPVPVPIALALREKGLVEPCGDGLLGESQTYRVSQLQRL